MPFPELSAAQRERLFYIEYLLLFTGQLRRKDLVNRFSISEPAATKDLSIFSVLAPEIIEYDRRQKHYKYRKGSLKFEHDVDQSLFALAGERALTQSFDNELLIPSAVNSSIKRQLPIEIVSAITRCISQRLSAKCNYLSLTSGEKERVLSPVATVHDGLRWHVRCFDHEAKKFKDYNLARFVSVVESTGTEVSLESDNNWNKIVEIKLVAHPKLSNPETIEWDYHMMDGVRRIETRACLVLSLIHI